MNCHVDSLNMQVEAGIACYLRVKLGIDCPVVTHTHARTRTHVMMYHINDFFFRFKDRILLVV